MTNPREVRGMLDLVDNFTKDRAIIDQFSYRIETTFLEPACGTGNFLVEIIERKLVTVLKEYEKKKLQPKQYTQLELERHAAFDIFRSLASIYGIDIDRENVDETRARLLKIIEGWWAKAFSPEIPKQYSHVFRQVLVANIALGDSLTQKGMIQFLDYPKEKLPKPFYINYSVWTIQDIEDKAQGKLSRHKPVSRMIRFEDFDAKEAFGN